MNEQTEMDTSMQGAAEAADTADDTEVKEQVPEEVASDVYSQMADDMKAAIEAGDFDINAYLQQYRAVIVDKEEADAKLMRLQADFDNFRRRARQDNEVAVFGASSAVMVALLPVLDNLERALKGMKEGPDRDGVAMIVKQFQGALQSVGLTEIEAEGADFDPNLHQAVLQIEAGEEMKGKVVMVLQKGYLLHERLVRAAMVQVGI